MLIKWNRKNRGDETTFDVITNEVTGIWFKYKNEAIEFSELWLDWLQTGKHFSIVSGSKPQVKIKVSMPDVDLQLTETLVEHLVFYEVPEATIAKMQITFSELPFKKPLEKCTAYQRACSRVLLNHLEDKLVIVYSIFDGLTVAEKIALQVFEKRCTKSTIIYVMSDPLDGKYFRTLYGQNKNGDFLLLKRNEAK